MFVILFVERQSETPRIQLCLSWQIVFQDPLSQIVFLISISNFTQKDLTMREKHLLIRALHLKCRIPTEIALSVHSSVHLTSLLLGHSILNTFQQNDFIFKVYTKVVDHWRKTSINFGIMRLRLPMSLLSFQQNTWLNKDTYIFCFVHLFVCLWSLSLWHDIFQCKLFVFYTKVVDH